MVATGLRGSRLIRSFEHVRAFCQLREQGHRAPPPTLGRRWAPLTRKGNAFTLRTRLDQSNPSADAGAKRRRRRIAATAARSRDPERKTRAEHPSRTFLRLLGHTRGCAPLEGLRRGMAAADPRPQRRAGSVIYRTDSAFDTCCRSEAFLS